MLPDVLCLVHKIQHKSVGFAGTGTVQAGKGLHRLDALQLFIHDHGVEQRFVKSGLIFIGNDEDVILLLWNALRNFLSVVMYLPFSSRFMVASVKGFSLG